MKFTHWALMGALAAAPVFAGSEIVTVSAPTNLGTLGGSTSAASTVSHNGKVIGGSSTTDGDAATNGFVLLNGSFMNVGVLSGGTNSYVNSVTNAGVPNTVRAAGYSDYNDPNYGPVENAFIYEKNTLISLGTLGGSNSWGQGINVYGVVVGYSYTAGDAETDAFISNPRAKNALIDLGTLGGSGSQAFAINDLGLVVGNSYTTNTDDYGNQIQDAAAWQNGTIYDLGNLGGGTASAFGVNNLGEIVGEADLPSGNGDAFVTNINASALTDIGNLGGSYAQANAVNHWGVVVGFANTTGDASVDAFVYTPKLGMVDLNTLLPANSGWTLQYASGIGDDGTIVGQGIYNGQSVAFSWTLKQFGRKQ